MAGCALGPLGFCTLAFSGQLFKASLGYGAVGRLAHRDVGLLARSVFVLIRLTARCLVMPLFCESTGLVSFCDILLWGCRLFEFLA
jgi:hypothetical protein